MLSIPARGFAPVLLETFGVPFSGRPRKRGTPNSQALNVFHRIIDLRALQLAAVIDVNRFPF